MTQAKPSKNFLIAAGGTGMRCLQSFLNMCAMGMYEGESVDILLLETDIENGDKKNSENLVNWYQTLCTNNAGKFGFFGPQVNFYTFVPDYSKDNKRRFTLISRVEEGDSETNRMLADLFYEEGVQEFDLMHGFRAQTHVGTFLMYHAIIEEIKEAVAKDLVRNKSQLFKFINNIKEQNTQGEARVFVVGSTFGGTGASSIPVMARAITDSAKIITGGVIKMEDIYFGAVILTPYFSFKSPSKEHKKAERVIADAQFFAHNSAAALMYYIKDETINTTYKRFYFLGWPFQSLNMDDYKAKVMGTDGGKTITGGKSQENPAHPNEFMGAFAAKHFFEMTKKEWFKETYNTDIRFKAIEYEKNQEDKIAYFHFDDMIEGEVKGAAETADKKVKAKTLPEIFKNNMAGLYYLNLLIQDEFAGNVKNLLEVLARYNYTYNFSDAEIEAFSRFAEYFTFKRDGEIVKPGWVPQMFYSLNAPKEGQFLNMHPNAMDVLMLRDKDKASQFNKRLMFNEFAKTGKASDVFVSKWAKYNKPIKKGNKKEFFEHMKTTFDHLNVINWFKENINTQSK